MPNRSRSDQPLTPGRRRALVRSALGAMVYRVDATRVALIADDCDGLDVPATFARAALWGAACRRALDAGEPLPAALASPTADAAAAALENADELDDVAAPRRRSGAA